MQKQTQQAPPSHNGVVRCGVVRPTSLQRTYRVSQGGVGVGGGGGVIGVAPMRGSSTDVDWGWPTEGSSLMCGYPQHRGPVSLAMPDQQKIWHALAAQGSSKLMGKSFRFHSPAGGGVTIGGGKHVGSGGRREKGSACGVVWCGVAWCCVVWCGVVLRGVVWLWCGVVWCGVAWRGVGVSGSEWE
jgi:hypothetical protein